MKFLLLGLIFFTSAATANPFFQNWKKLDFKPSPLIQEIRLNESKVMNSSDGIRTGVTLYKFNNNYDKWPVGVKPTHSINISMYDCKENLLSVLITIFYENDKIVSIKKYDRSNIQVLSSKSDLIFETEYKAICEIPASKLLLDPKNGTMI